MAITVQSQIAADLAQTIRIAAGSRYFEWRPDRGLLTSALPELAMQAWFRLDLYEGGLVFTIVAPRHGVLTTDVYAKYHAQMLETLLRHFSTMFHTAILEPMHEEVPPFSNHTKTDLDQSA